MCVQCYIVSWIPSMKDYSLEEKQKGYWFQMIEVIEVNNVDKGDSKYRLSINGEMCEGIDAYEVKPFLNN